MVRIHDNADSIVIDTIKSFKLGSILLFEENVSYQLNQDNNWIRVSTGRQASERDTKKLNYWLANHKKFVLGEIQ